MTPLTVDAVAAARPARLAAHARREHRRPRDRRHQRSRRRPEARGRRSELVLSARLLLERQAGREVPRDHRSREAPRRAGARAARLSGGDAGSDDRRRAAAVPRRRNLAIPASKRRSLPTRKPPPSSAAIGPLAGYTRDVPLRVQMAAGWKPGDATSAALWVVGELGGVADARSPVERRVRRDRHADDAGRRHGRHAAALTAARGARTFRVALTPSQPLAAGDYVLRVGARAGSATDPVARGAAARDSGGAGFGRRVVHPPRTDHRQQGSADRRPAVPPERSRFASKSRRRPTPPVTARLLDRTGKPLAVPVTAAVRDDAGRIALADGAARAGAAGAGRLRDRDCGWRTAIAVGVPHRPLTTLIAESAETVLDRLRTSSCLR